MKKLLLMSAVFLLAFAGLVQAQEAEPILLDLNEDMGLMQESGQGEMKQMRLRDEGMSGSGEMIQERIQERVSTMQARKSQLREALKKKEKLQDKMQLMKQYKANEVSEFVKGINSRVKAQKNRMENLSDKAGQYFEKMETRMEKMSDEKRGKAMGIKDDLLRSHEVLESRFVELSEMRAELSALKEDANWQEWKNKMDNYKSLLMEIRDEMKAAIAESKALENEVE